MPVKVAFVDNPLAQGGKSIPRVVRGSGVTFSRLLDYMSKDTALEQEDLRSMFALLANALIFFLPEGGTVTTPIGSFALGVRSRVNDANTNGHPRIVDQDSLHIRFRADAAWLDRLRIAAAVETIAAPTPLAPTVTYIEDVEQAPDAGQFAAGDIIHIEGGRLSFDKTDTELGVFLVPTSGKAATRATVYSRIGSANVDCKIPLVTAGEYFLEVRTRPTRTDVRAGRLKETVTIG